MSEPAFVPYGALHTPYGHGDGMMRVAYLWGQVFAQDRNRAHHPVAREAAHGSGLRSRVKRKRKARRYRAFAVTMFMRPDGSAYRTDEL